MRLLGVTHGSYHQPSLMYGSVRTPIIDPRENPVLVIGHRRRCWCLVGGPSGRCRRRGEKRVDEKAARGLPAAGDQDPSEEA